jgi:hypothetical protein
VAYYSIVDSFYNPSPTVTTWICLDFREQFLRTICVVPRKMLLLLPPQPRQQHDGRSSHDDHNNNVALSPLARRAHGWMDWMDGWIDGWISGWVLSVFPNWMDEPFECFFLGNRGYLVWNIFFKKNQNDIWSEISFYNSTCKGFLLYIYICNLNSFNLILVILVVPPCIDAHFHIQRFHFLKKNLNI